MITVLIVEDEISLAKEITNYLKDSGYTCKSVHLYKHALEALKEEEFTVVLLDLKLPDGNGLDIIQYLKKKKSAAGIIVLSARDELDMRIQALEIGADDFLTKPFHLSELNARLKALVRRNLHKGNNQIAYNEINVDIDKKTAYIHAIPLVLTVKEFELLLYFISNSGRVVSKEAISFSIWRHHSDMDISNEIIYTHVKNLRKKLIVAGSKDYIKSVYGVGYKFDD